MNVPTRSHAPAWERNLGTLRRPTHKSEFYAGWHFSDAGASGNCVPTPERGNEKNSVLSLTNAPPSLPPNVPPNIRPPAGDGNARPSARCTRARRVRRTNVDRRRSPLHARSKAPDTAGRIAPNRSIFSYRRPEFPVWALKAAREHNRLRRFLARNTASRRAWRSRPIARCCSAARRSAARFLRGGAPRRIRRRIFW